MKILITGCTGMLGSSIILENKIHDIWGIYIGKKPQFQQAVEMDITNKDNVEKYLNKIKPDAIIHTAALTNVDLCEKDPVLANKVHVQGTENLVNMARKLNSYFVYISTDSVFDGIKGNFTELDQVNPLNVYAKTKYYGERSVLSWDKSAVARTNIYGWNWLSKSSIAEWILNSLRSNKQLTLFKDVFFTPILTNDLAKILVQMCEKEICGLFHISGSESISKLDFGISIAEIFHLDKNVIKPISVVEANLDAKRPLNPTLNCQKIMNILKIKLPSVKDGLLNFKFLEDSGYNQILKEF